jgi:hypothetical protein
MTALAHLDAQGRPDLQRLVELFGGYDKITPSAWAQWMTGDGRETSVPMADRHLPGPVGSQSSARSLLHGTWHIAWWP